MSLPGTSSTLVLARVSIHQIRKAMAKEPIDQKPKLRLSQLSHGSG